MANNKVYNFIGKIKEKKLETVYNKKSEHYGNQYLRCQVIIEDEPQIKELLIFKEKLEKEIIWEEIEQKNYLGKKYLFKVQRRPGAGRFFRLIDWEAITNCSVKQIINHGKKK
ncbi:MAG: hypothetical protein I3273_03785 [Candidatus Moeniiplasma glomeromycotorum]|nr:hypothetical protein [Candidatus Moeniiplasma glomeromycotorum]MCE8169217.1 hypothetical protein [Candidatus Moeniiplasma glomeromycotorum]